MPVFPCSCVALTSSAWTLRSVYSVVFTRRALWRKIQCSVIAAPSSTAPLQTEPLPTILLMLLTGLKVLRWTADDVALAQEHHSCTVQ